MFAEGQVESQKLGVVWLSFWFSTRFTRKKLDHSCGIYLYRKDTHYATKKGVKSAGRVVQSVRRKGLGRVGKCPDSTPKVSKILKSRFWIFHSKFFSAPAAPHNFWVTIFRGKVLGWGCGGCMWVGELIICYKKRELQDTMEIWVKISIGVCGI